MQLKCIAAICELGGIGFNNRLPWSYVKKDMLYFKNQTIPKYDFDVQSMQKVAVLMGTNTFLSLPKPLKKRDMFVLSRNPNMFKKKVDSMVKDNKSIQCNIFSSLNDVMSYSNKNKYDILWCIGGQQIYSLAFNNWIFDEVHITYIHKYYECDTFLNIPEYYSQKQCNYDFDETEKTFLSFHVFTPNYDKLEKTFYIS